MTALSLLRSDWLLSAAQVDLAVIEVGIGGAYDCTNIIRWGGGCVPAWVGVGGVVGVRFTVCDFPGGRGSVGSPPWESTTPRS